MFDPQPFPLLPTRSFRNIAFGLGAYMQTIWERSALCRNRNTIILQDHLRSKAILGIFQPKHLFTLSQQILRMFLRKSSLRSLFCFLSLQPAASLCFRPWEAEAVRLKTSSGRSLGDLEAVWSSFRLVISFFMVIYDCFMAFYGDLRLLHGQAGCSC